jgi:hypothetical protein
MSREVVALRLFAAADTFLDVMMAGLAHDVSRIAATVLALL